MLTNIKIVRKRDKRIERMVKEEERKRVVVVREVIL